MYLIWSGKHVHTLVKVVGTGELLALVSYARSPLCLHSLRRLAPGDSLFVKLLFAFPDLMAGKNQGLENSHATKGHAERQELTVL